MYHCTCLRTCLPELRAYRRVGEASLRASRGLPGNECSLGVAENERIDGEPGSTWGSDHQEEAFRP